jgi:hypothetical protein
VKGAERPKIDQLLAKTVGPADAAGTRSSRGSTSAMASWGLVVLLGHARRWLRVLEASGEGAVA